MIPAFDSFNQIHQGVRKCVAPPELENIVARNSNPQLFKFVASLFKFESPGWSSTCKWSSRSADKGWPCRNGTITTPAHSLRGTPTGHPRSSSTTSPAALLTCPALRGAASSWWEAKPMRSVHPTTRHQRRRHAPEAPWSAGQTANPTRCMRPPAELCMLLHSDAATAAAMDPWHQPLMIHPSCSTTSAPAANT